MASTAGEQADLIRTIFNGEQGRQNIERQLLTRKTFERLVGIADADGAKPAATKSKSTKAAKAESTEAAESGETEVAETEKKPKARRSSPRKAE
jgi:hypothetical protein